MSGSAEPVIIRPHHGMCTEYFSGHGYSSGFTQNMTEKIKYLEMTDPQITLMCKADIFCEKCPENAGGCCKSGKPSKYDEKVLEICGLSWGDVMHWSSFKAAVREKLLDKGRFREVCGDCQWKDLCGK